LADFEAFFAAFFCFLGNFILFFFASFGTFGLGGVAMPTAAATFPTAAPTDFAAVTKALSGASSALIFFAIRFCWRQHSTAIYNRAS
jgi:hypothetical protein